MAHKNDSENQSKSYPKKRKWKNLHLHFRSASHFQAGYGAISPVYLAPHKNRKDDKINNTNFEKTDYIWKAFPGDCFPHLKHLTLQEIYEIFSHTSFMIEAISPTIFIIFQREKTEAANFINTAYLCRAWRKTCVSRQMKVSAAHIDVKEANDMTEACLNSHTINNRAYSEINLDTNHNTTRELCKETASTTCKI